MLLYSFQGTLIGIAVTFTDIDGHVAKSVRKWININGEVLLLTFLPGLIFKDAYGQNVHLFVFALNQLLIFAFPMVLAGTALTACVGYFIFPFNWSFDLAMTFGSILAATDPVAVAALLEEVRTTKLQTNEKGWVLYSETCIPHETESG